MIKLHFPPAAYTAQLTRFAKNRVIKKVDTRFSLSEEVQAVLKDNILFLKGQIFGIGGHFGRLKIYKSNKVYTCDECKAIIGAGEVYTKRTNHEEGRLEYKFCLSCGLEHARKHRTTYNYGGN